MSINLSEAEKGQILDDMILYEDALHEWHRCVAAEQENPEAFGLAETAQEQVRVCEARLSEPEAEVIRQMVETELAFYEGDYITEL